MKYILLLAFSLAIFSCKDSNKVKTDVEKSDTTTEVVAIPIEVKVNKDVPIKSYFKWMDSIVAQHNETHNYTIDEYIIVHNNKWIIDTLAHTDYYYLMDKGIFNEDSQALLALTKDRVLEIPDSIQTQKIREQLSNTHLELNIPEYRLRIFQDDKEIYKFPVRVGKVGKKYLAMAGRQVDMRTMPGIGEIVRVNKDPIYMNPVDNKKYKTTSRDDKKRTELPAIPWLEPAINGVKIGQLIHPTTNMGTLGKAASNGCIGLRESDAWIVYYYAPLGTKFISKYELEGKNDQGETVQFKDIYPGFDKIELKEVPRDSLVKNMLYLDPEL